jgi:hypothetical protein
LFFFFLRIYFEHTRCGQDADKWYKMLGGRNVTGEVCGSK